MKKKRQIYSQISYFFLQSSGDGDMLKIIARLEAKSPLIEANKYGDLKFFMELIASKLSEPVILKKSEIQ